MNISQSNELDLVQPVVLVSDQIARVHILRLDKIHPVVSGNKWFKLKEWLVIAEKQKKTGLFTAGGPFSNHIVATAFAAKSAGLKCAAFIRGEQPKQPSPTLEDAKAYGMELVFTERQTYSRLKNSPYQNSMVPDNYLFIPEGGEGLPGVKGAAGILALVPEVGQYTHIFCAVGTGTMLAGLSNAALSHQQVVGISSLKGMDNISEKIRGWQLAGAAPFKILWDYHFGGYAKHPPELLDFMNHFYQISGIPTDMVYTAKLMFAIKQLLEKGHINGEDRILAIHSGGLQGNRSLKKGQLIFL
jgi:1-aminocyclopropane-1-carboxylate deaminase/D-cysteine desulfhydrase-like pyridoxal-dependent ACC family enzyme